MTDHRCPNECDDCGICSSRRDAMEALMSPTPLPPSTGDACDGCYRADVKLHRELRSVHLDGVWTWRPYWLCTRCEERRYWTCIRVECFDPITEGAYCDAHQAVRNHV